MNNIYKQEFLHYYKNQPNKRELENPTHKGRDVNTSCGDDLTVELKVENDKIKKIGYNGEGCAICEGAMSILSENIISKSTNDIKKLTIEEYLELLGLELTISRQKCALIGFNALKNALK